MENLGPEKMDNLCMETELKNSALQLNETKLGVSSPMKLQINFCDSDSPLSPENCTALSLEQLEMSVSKESLLQWTMEEEELLYKSDIFNHKDLPTSPDSDKNIIRSHMNRSLNESLKGESLNPIIGNRKNRSEPLSNTRFSISQFNPDTKPSDWLSPFPMPNESNDEDIILEIPLEKLKIQERAKHESHITNIESNQCHLCKRVLSSKSSLIRHYQQHAGEKAFKCNICKKHFTRSNSLKNHVCRFHNTTMSSKIKSNKCHLCNRVFSSKFAFKCRYQPYTGERPYKCSICKKYFELRNSLTRKCHKFHNIRMSCSPLSNPCRAHLL